MGKGYAIKAKQKEADIWLYEEIGSGWFGGVSAKDFAEDIKKLGKVETINLFINSPGGDVFDGIAMYNILKQHGANIIVNIDGLAASIASVIAMAGNEIYMAANAFIMVHNAWGITIGDAGDMRSMAETLEKIDGSIIDTYARRTGRDEEIIANLMADETWMTADQAKELGFVDDLYDAQQLAAFDLSKFNFRHVPEGYACQKEKPAATSTESQGIDWEGLGTSLSKSFVEVLKAHLGGGSQPMLDNPQDVKEMPKPPDLSVFDRALEKGERVLAAYGGRKKR
jgi:ATP-dependent Clp endopeptidase proteolytic subunit ClpP